MMESQNLYESLYHNAVLDTDQVDSLRKRDGWISNNTGYTNSGFDDHSYELPLRDCSVSSRAPSLLDAQNKGRIRENDLYQGLSEEEILAAQNANIRKGIRQFAMANSTGGKRETSNSNSYNCCLTVCVVILLLASISSSAYVFYRYQVQKADTCTSKTPVTSRAQYVNNATTDKELREISQELEKLHHEIQQFGFNETKPLSTREDRKRFRQFSEKAKEVEKEVNIMEKNITTQMQIVDKDFRNSVTQLDNKINGFRGRMTKCEAKFKALNETLMAQVFNMSEEIKREVHSQSLGKCRYKTRSNTRKEVNKTVTVVEKKDGGSSIVGVTCCTTYQKDFVFKHAFLTVEEQGNTSYTCHCFNCTNCGLCYWECSK